LVAARHASSPSGCARAALAAVAAEGSTRGVAACTRGLERANGAGSPTNFGRRLAARSPASSASAARTGRVAAGRVAGKLGGQLGDRAATGWGGVVCIGCTLVRRTVPTAARVVAARGGGAAAAGAGIHHAAGEAAAAAVDASTSASAASSS